MSNIFPNIKTETLAIKLFPAGERSAKKRHPWVFESSIKKISKEGKAGDLAIIYDQKKNKFIALGLYDPDSPIRLKLIQFGESAKIDEKWFEHIFEKAFLKRESLLQTDTNSYRLIHGENDRLPGLIVDVYDQVAVIKIYSRIWLPFLEIISNQVSKTSKSKVQVLRMSRNVQKSKELFGLREGQVIFGELENENVLFREHGLLFSANVVKGHKTGYFLDHRHNRKKVGELAKGKTVLDIFAYAGGFSVHALCGGAVEVVSLDISNQALEMSKKNVALNLENVNHRTLAADAFEGMQNLVNQKKKFDLIIIDPPSFAKRESEVEKALNSYVRLTKLGAKLVKKDGILLLASCSSRVKSDQFFETVEFAMKEGEIQFELLEKTFHDDDHPIEISEAAYLKCGYYKIR